MHIDIIKYYQSFQNVEIVLFIYYFVVETNKKLNRIVIYKLRIAKFISHNSVLFVSAME